MTAELETMNMLAMNKLCSVLHPASDPRIWVRFMMKNAPNAVASSVGNPIRPSRVKLSPRPIANIRKTRPT